MKPGRPRKLPLGAGDVGRCAKLLPGWVMLRSIGRAEGEVAVDGGAENVCEPRLPALKRGRASALETIKSAAAKAAQSASSARG